MGSAQGKHIDVGSRKLTVKSHLKTGKDKNLYLVRDNTTNQAFILKRTIVKKGLNNVLARAKWEAALYANVPKHKNLLSCYGLKRFLNKDGDAENLLILEYCSGGSLKQALSRRTTPFSVPQALTCLRNICSCIAFLHAQEPAIMHLGIRTDNIFLHESGQWKLGDFACSAVSPIACEGSDDLKKFEKLIEVRRAYRAPEIVNIRQTRLVDVKADTWALGCVFYALLFNSLPFSGDSKSAIVKGEYSVPNSPAYEKPVLTLLRSMLEPDPAKRISSAALRSNVLDLYSQYCSQNLNIPSSASAGPWQGASLSRVWGHRSFETSLSSTGSQSSVGSAASESPSPRNRGSIDVSGWVTKVTTTELVRPKAKYVRRLVILAWERHEAGSLPLPGFFENLQRQPVLTNSVVAYKALQTVHQMIQEGPPSFVDQALHSRSFLLSIAEHWSLSPTATPKVPSASSTNTAPVSSSNPSATPVDRYLAELLPSYAQVLEQRLLLLRDAFVFEGNFGLGQYLQKVRSNLKTLHSDTWLGRCAEVLSSTLEHGLALSECARIALGTSGVAPSKACLRFRETALVPILDDLLALFGVCTFFAGILRDTQVLRTCDVGGLERGYGVFFDRVHALIGRVLDSDVVRMLRKAPPLPNVAPIPTLHSPFYPTPSNVPGLAKHNVEYCEELRSFFLSQLEEAGFVVLPFDAALSLSGNSSLSSSLSRSGGMSKNKSSWSRTTLADLEKMWPHHDRASTVPAQRSDRTRASFDMQKTLQDFISDFDEPPQTPERKASIITVIKPAVTKSRSISPWHQTGANSPQLATRALSRQSSTSSPPSSTEPRSRTWTKAAMRRSRTPTGLRWDSNDIGIEWARADAPTVFDEPVFAQATQDPSASVHPSDQRWNTSAQPSIVHLKQPKQGKPRLRQRPASAETTTLHQTKEIIHRQMHPASQNPRPAAHQYSVQANPRSHSQMQRPQTAGDSLMSSSRNSQAMQPRRPQTAGFKPSPFDQLVIEEQRNSHQLTPGMAASITNHRASLVSNISGSDADGSEDLEEFDKKEEDDDNPFAVIEKSIKAAESVKDASPQQVTNWSSEQRKSDIKEEDEDSNEGHYAESSSAAQEVTEIITNSHVHTRSLARPEKSEFTNHASADESASDDESLDHDEIDFDEMVLGERVGVGGFAEVYKGEWRGTDVAVKKLLIQKASDETLKEFRKEVDILRRLRHPNIVMFMGACTKPPNLSLVTELLQMSLFDLLHNTSVKLSWKIRFKMAIDTATGMNFLHKSKPPIVHRDLKSANLLLDKHYGVKVSDFGLSRVKAYHYTMTGQCGTFQWMAPEVIANERYTEKADVFSYGVILWEMVARKIPFEGMNGVQVSVAVATRGLRPTIPKDTPPGIADIMRDCWEEVPEDRPSFGEIVQRLKELRKETLGS